MDDMVNSKVEGNDPDAINQNLQILERLKRAANVKSDRALAEFLGIEPQNITTAKKRRIPEKWIVKISKTFGYSVNYFLTGKQDESEGTKLSDNGSSSTSPTKIGANKPGLGETVDLLAQIIQSGKEPIIQALHCTLMALSDAVESTNSLESISRLNQDLRRENTQLRARLDSSKIERLEQRIENIEKLYQEQLKKKTGERREIMHKLGSILGFNNSDGEKTKQQPTKR